MASHETHTGNSHRESGVDTPTNRFDKLTKDFFERYEMTPERREKIKGMFEHIAGFLDSPSQVTPELISADSEDFKQYKAEQEAILQKLQRKDITAKLEPFSISSFLAVANHPVFGIEGKDRFLDAWVGRIYPPKDGGVGFTFNLDDCGQQGEIYDQFQLRDLERKVTGHLEKRLASILETKRSYGGAWNQAYNCQNGQMYHAANHIGLALLFATQKERPEHVLDASLAIVDLITTGPFPPIQTFPNDVKSGDNRYYAFTK